ncbi:Zinc-finger domain of monoamine-oxidase A repressor R [Trema orientale]|uniref:Zinc-finger domain of monoamine-oxidase A repressor R n=1 Tax=Trema orientale TaxID=63057 RepID=A0A2P5FY38_TREOI|nr:Zinc-finger domain of monoamine-oxidase A repressor R [Trema orientale]
MRYGEHVLEAKQNPNWICPACRGICNCSLCRQAKGWAPTGSLYRKISQLGFKSVAHYLIQTFRSETMKGNTPDAKSEIPEKWSLPFSDVDAVPNDSLKVTDDQHDSSEELKHKSNDEYKNSDHNQNSAKRALPFSNMGLASENIGSLEVDHMVEDPIGSKLHMEPAQDTELSIECIAGKLRQRSAKSDCRDDDLPEAEEKVMDGKQAVEEISLEKEMDQENDFHFTCNKHESVKKIPMEGIRKVKETSTATTINSDSIAGRLKRRRVKGCDHDDEKNSDASAEVISLEIKVEKRKEVLPSDIKHYGECNDPLETSPKLKPKRVQAAEPNPDSVAGRLRQRRRMGHSHDDEKLGLLEKNSDTLQAANHLSESNFF